MLMSEVAALGQAAQVEVVAAFLIPEMGAPAADDGRRLPLGLDTPAMENVLAFISSRPALFCAIHLSNSLCSITEHQFVLRTGCNPIIVPLSIQQCQRPGHGQNEK
jgi:hypothetical protein